MKDYELDKSKKGLFILNYEVKDDKIVVNYANEDSVVIPYTEKNESIILDNMKKQILNAEEFEINCKGNIVLYSILFIFGILVSGLSSIFSFVSSFLKYAFLWGGIGLTTFSGINILGWKYLKKDIKKNKKFLEIESTLNEKVKGNENILYKTHRVTKNIVKDSQDNKVVFTINNIDKVPFSDLNQIMANIEREEKYNFEYPEVVNSKTKKKTK